MSATRTKNSIAESTPVLPQTSPNNYTGHTHDFTLQAVMELQKSVGELTSTIKTMSTSLDGVKAKVDDLVGWKNKIIGGAAVLTVVGALLGFLVGKFSDLFVLKSSIQTEQVNVVVPKQSFNQPQNVKQATRAAPSLSGGN